MSSSQNFIYNSAGRTRSPTLSHPSRASNRGEDHHSSYTWLNPDAEGRDDEEPIYLGTQPRDTPLPEVATKAKKGKGRETRTKKTVSRLERVEIPAPKKAGWRKSLTMSGALQKDLDDDLMDVDMVGSKQKAKSKAAIESEGDIFDDGVKQRVHSVRANLLISSTLA